MIVWFDFIVLFGGGSEEYFSNHSDSPVNIPKPASSRRTTAEEKEDSEMNWYYNDITGNLKYFPFNLVRFPRDSHWLWPFSSCASGDLHSDMNRWLNTHWLTVSVGGSFSHSI